DRFEVPPPRRASPRAWSSTTRTPAGRRGTRPRAGRAAAGLASGPRRSRAVRGYGPQEAPSAQQPAGPATDQPGPSWKRRAARTPPGHHHRAALRAEPPRHGRGSRRAGPRGRATAAGRCWTCPSCVIRTAPASAAMSPTDASGFLRIAVTVAARILARLRCASARWLAARFAVAGPRRAPPVGWAFFVGMLHLSTRTGMYEI